jgi:hypothetical protein
MLFFPTCWDTHNPLGKIAGQKLGTATIKKKYVRLSVIKRNHMYVFYRTYCRNEDNEK